MISRKFPFLSCLPRLMHNLNNKLIISSLRWTLNLCTRPRYNNENLNAIRLNEGTFELKWFPLTSSFSSSFQILFIYERKKRKNKRPSSSAFWYDDVVVVLYGSRIRSFLFKYSSSQLTTTWMCFSSLVPAPARLLYDPYPYPSGCWHTQRVRTENRQRRYAPPCSNNIRRTSRPF